MTPEVYVFPPPDRDEIRRVMIIAELGGEDVAQALADWLAKRGNDD